MSDPNVPLDALPSADPPEKELMPAEVKEARRLMWVQSFLGIQGILFALFLYALNTGHMPWIIWPLAVLPMLTGPLSLLLGTRMRWVLAMVLVVEGGSILEFGYCLLLMQAMGIFMFAYIILGVVVIARLAKVPPGSWFDR
ncbi:hypothetical protein [Streptosporangium sp. NPDC051022]|uniref:hypothetical protein n=1 Tax=Streptosporangium sp. NPDC051022 TaxID=3155752 RepID=UPI00343AFF84